jgi:hypothetical protein
MQTLVADALLLEDTAGRKRLSISNGILSYDFRPASLETLASQPDCVTSPLEILIRSAALRRDFSTSLPEQVFWIQPLKQADTLAATMVDVAYKVPDKAQCPVKQQQYKAEAEAGFRSLEERLIAYAGKAGLSTAGTRGFADAYRIEIRVDPPRARIRLMPFLDYKRCLYFGLPLEEHWNDLSEGTQELIGRYHYRAEWPPSLNGPEEGNLDIHESGRITFRPKAN